MKQALLMIAMVALVGCGKQEQTDANESTPTTTEKPVKELTLEEKKVVGTYEMVNTINLNSSINVPNTYTFKLLDNKVYVVYTNSKKVGGGKWTIANGEIHTLITSKVGIETFSFGKQDGEHLVYRINPEGFGLKAGSLTGIAEYEYNTDNRKGLPENRRHTFKKLD